MYELECVPFFFFFFFYFALSQGGPLVYRMGRRALVCIEM